MKIDVTTWCSKENIAANELAKELEKIGDEKLVAKVSNYFQKFDIRMYALNFLHKEQRKFYLQLLLKHTQDEIKLNFTHIAVKSFMLNIIQAKYRNELVKVDTSPKLGSEILKEMYEKSQIIHSHLPESDESLRIGEDD